MISQVNGEKPAGGLLALLRTVALIAALVGALGSVGLVLQVGPAQAFPAPAFGTLRDLGAVTICGPGSRQHRFEELVGHYPSDSL